MLPELNVRLLADSTHERVRCKSSYQSAHRGSARPWAASFCADLRLITSIRLTNAVLHRVAPGTSAPIARSWRIGIGPIVVAVITTLVTVTPIWIAHLHIYARAGIINSLSFSRFKSASRHRADKTKRKHRFCNRSHVACPFRCTPLDEALLGTNNAPLEHWVPSHDA
jgi:hypothetical protein